MKNQDSILIFGSSGQIGKSLIRKFTKITIRLLRLLEIFTKKDFKSKHNQIMDT